MTDPPEGDGDRVDVTRIMETIREDIRRRREALPVDKAVAERLRTLADETELDPELLGPLLRGEAGWNLNPDYRIPTHRVGVARFLVLTLKRLVGPVVRLYTNPLVERQAQINLYLLRVVEALLVETTRLQRAVDSLRPR
jgi:hypothetical protein